MTEYAKYISMEGMNDRILKKQFSNAGHDVEGTYPMKVEERFQQFEFKASALLVKNWKGSVIVDDVYKKESQEKFRSSQDRIMNRIELWISICNIEKQIDHVHSGESKKFLSIKKRKRCEPHVRRSNSLESIYLSQQASKEKYPPKHRQRLGKTRGRTFDGFLPQPSGNRETSRSSDYINDLHERTAEIKLTDSCSFSSLEKEELQTSSNVQSKSKRKFPFNIFFKTNTQTTGRTKWYTPRVRKKRNNNESNGNYHTSNNTDFPNSQFQPLPSKFDIDQYQESDSDIDKMSLGNERKSSQPSIDQFSYVNGHENHASSAKRLSRRISWSKMLQSRDKNQKLEYIGYI